MDLAFDAKKHQKHLSAIQAATQSTVINVQIFSISGNDKNKPLTLLSQFKLALTARNTFALKNDKST
jgi:hypothetical protein